MKFEKGNAAETGEKPEVADAVIAEMRDEAARADTEQYYTLDDAAESMREYANRLEAALKRERAAHTCECGEIAALAIKEAQKPVGNAAAMREAFKGLDEEMTFCERNVELRIGLALEGLREHCRIVRQILNAALSAPARNCDLYSCVEDSWTDYKQFCTQKGDALYFDMVHFWPFAKWLLASAAEKGAGDGSK